MAIVLPKSEKLDKMRHSLAHIMAYAVTDLFPGTKVGIGPAIENGFYYDFKFPKDVKITFDDFATIEKKMRQFLNEQISFDKEVVSREYALDFFQDEPFKIELIKDFPDDVEISIYKSGGFSDLCRGPHVDTVKEINAQGFKLMKLAGAYWRGDEKREMLTRIYATAWEKPQDLKTYLKMLEDAEKNDHRKLGTSLDLFHIAEENPGNIFWHPNGWTIYLTIKEYMRKRLKEFGYKEVNTPAVMPQSLWERSGHWAKYKKNMFVTESEKRLFALKPMNCPGHVEIFKKGITSYKDLPLRLAEFGSCTRNEPSGSLHGIFRVRGFVQDDAHIFCTPEQITSEVADFCELLKVVYTDFGFDIHEPGTLLVMLSTRPELRVGDDETWDKAEKNLAEACKLAGFDYEIAEGEGAFYGPKLEFTLVDSMGRPWQCGTIQLDYQLPSKDRLNAEYIGEDNEKHTPVMLHRAVLGSLERFIGVLIETYGGALPPWLSPTQVVVVPVAPTFNEYADKIADELNALGIRVFADTDNDRMNAKIRKWQGQKVPYQLIVGQKELDSNSVNVRFRSSKNQKSMQLNEFIDFLQNKLDSYSKEVQ
ncbi:MAG: threonine--tRNA ligase [Treponema sp.]|nr:MAG: threonine--tRNA ligase [Treponema sp.]